MCIVNVHSKKWSQGEVLKGKTEEDYIRHLETISFGYDVNKQGDVSIMIRQLLDTCSYKRTWDKVVVAVVQAHGFGSSIFWIVTLRELQVRTLDLYFQLYFFLFLKD